MREFFKDKRGSSLVMVLVTMTFMMILGVTVITMTITNIRLKAAQKESQANFYDTDEVLDQMSAGLQNQSSKVSADAYSEALSVYNTVLNGGSSSTLQDTYNNKYLIGMVAYLSGSDEVTVTSALSGGTTEFTYKFSILESFVEESHKDYYLDYKNNNSGTGKLIVDGDTILLKDVSVKHADKRDFETTIKTDIRISVPTAETDAHSEYLDYAFIADDQIQVGSNMSATVAGNIYAGTVNRLTDVTDTGTTGVLLNAGSVLNLSASQLITRGDIRTRGTSTLNVDPLDSTDNYIWAENILTQKGTNSNNITLNATGGINVADDLEVNGSNDVVTLKGNYFGYNYNSDYSAANVTTVAKNASYSSAISINGKSDSLIFTDLNKLMLAGRTYITKKGNDDVENALISTANPDIQLGESLTVKSSQIAYYVPYGPAEGSVSTPLPSATAVVTGYVRESADYTDALDYAKSSGTTLYGSGTAFEGTGKYAGKYYFQKNSLYYEFDYKNYDDNYSGLSSFGKSVLDFIDLDEPLLMYTRHDVNVKTDEVTYFYLNVKTDSSDFYSYYVSGTQKSTIKNVNESYLSNDGILCNGGTVMTASGNILYRSTSGGNLNIKLSNADATVANSSLASYAKTLSKEYMSRQMSLIADYSVSAQASVYRLSNDATGHFTKSGKSDDSNLFDVLVDRAAMVSEGNNSGTMNVTLDDGSSEKCLFVVQNGDYTWDDSENSKFGTNTGIILATGNVSIQKDFNGLIIAGGDITVDATGVKINAASEDVDALFAADQALASPNFYNLFTKYFRKSVDATISASSSKSKEGSDVNYENWTKN